MSKPTPSSSSTTRQLPTMEEIEAICREKQHRIDHSRLYYFPRFVVDLGNGSTSAFRPVPPRFPDHGGVKLDILDMYHSILLGTCVALPEDVETGPAPGPSSS